MKTTTKPTYSYQTTMSYLRRLTAKFNETISADSVGEMMAWMDANELPYVTDAPEGIEENEPIRIAYREYVNEKVVALHKQAIKASKAEFLEAVAIPL